jgi:hypothetical protein
MSAPTAQAVLDRRKTLAEIAEADAEHIRDDVPVGGPDRG